MNTNPKPETQTALETVQSQDVVLAAEQAAAAAAEQAEQAAAAKAERLDRCRSAMVSAFLRSAEQDRSARAALVEYAQAAALRFSVISADGKVESFDKAAMQDEILRTMTDVRAQVIEAAKAASAAQLETLKVAADSAVGQAMTAATVEAARTAVENQIQRAKAELISRMGLPAGSAIRFDDGAYKVADASTGKGSKSGRKSKAEPASAAAVGAGNGKPTDDSTPSTPASADSQTIGENKAEPAAPLSAFECWQRDLANNPGWAAAVLRLGDFGAALADGRVSSDCERHHVVRSLISAAGTILNGGNIPAGLYDCGIVVRRQPPSRDGRPTLAELEAQAAEPAAPAEPAEPAALAAIVTPAKPRSRSRK